MEREASKKRNGDFRATDSRGGHLSDDEIIAYNYGNFPSAELERQAQNHLIECRRCTSALLELNSFAEVADSSSNARNTDVEWALFEQKRLAVTKDAAPETLTVEPKNASPFWNKYFKIPSFNFARAAAFALLALIVGGGIFLAFFTTTENPGGESAAVVNTPQPQRESNGDNNSLPPEKSVAVEQKNALENRSAADITDRRITNRGNQNSLSSASKTKNKASTENNNPSPPQIVRTPAFQDELALNRIDVSLYPNEVVRSGDEPELRKIRVKQNSVGQIRLKLNAPKSAERTAFSVEINDAQNKSVLTLPVLPDTRGDFYLMIPATKLPAARYSLRIYNEKDKTRSLYAEYAFEIVYE